MRKQHLYVLLCFTVLGSTVFAQKIENLTKLKRQSEKSYSIIWDRLHAHRHLNPKDIGYGEVLL